MVAFGEEQANIKGTGWLLTPRNQLCLHSSALGLQANLPTHPATVTIKQQLGDSINVVVASALLSGLGQSSHFRLEGL